MRLLADCLSCLANWADHGRRLRQQQLLQLFLVYEMQLHLLGWLDLRSGGAHRERKTLPFDILAMSLGFHGTFDHLVCSARQHQDFCQSLIRAPAQATAVPSSASPCSPASDCRLDTAFSPPSINMASPWSSPCSLPSVNFDLVSASCVPPSSPLYPRYCFLVVARHQAHRSPHLTSVLATPAPSAYYHQTRWSCRLPQWQLAWSGRTPAVP